MSSPSFSPNERSLSSGGSVPRGSLSLIGRPVVAPFIFGGEGKRKKYGAGHVDRRSQLGDA